MSMNGFSKMLMSTAKQPDTNVVTVNIYHKSMIENSTVAD